MLGLGRRLGEETVSSLCLLCHLLTKVLQEVLSPHFAAQKTKSLENSGRIVCQRRKNVPPYLTDQTMCYRATH